MKIKKGDTVKIILGKDKGKSGKVIKIDPEKNKALIEGLNLYKKHTRPRRQGEKGETVLVPRPVDVSNVKLICPACKNPARVGYRVENEIKFRYCKKCQAKI